MRIWLIMGGESAEREVSLVSGKAVAEGLRERGHSVWAYDLGAGAFLSGISTSPPPVPEPPPGQPGGWAEGLLRTARVFRDQVDVAFLALHGGAGEDGTVQALLASTGMPYTGSGPTASAVAMDKALTKWIMEAIEVPTPEWQLLSLEGDRDDWASCPLPGAPRLPLVVKPAREGSSVGVGIARTPEEWPPALRATLAAVGRKPGWPARILVERFIEGRELTVAILGGRPLPVVEILPREGFYDYRSKYTAGRTDYRAPADLGMHESERLQQYSARLFQALGCRGMARVDFRFTPGAEAYCLEINTIPGLTALSLLPMAAAAAGIAFGPLLEEICRHAGL